MANAKAKKPTAKKPAKKAGKPGTGKPGTGKPAAKRSGKPAKKGKPGTGKPAAKRSGKPAKKGKPVKKAATPAKKGKPAKPGKRAKPVEPSAKAAKPAAKPVPIPEDPAALAAAWNEAGRAYYADFSERLTRFYTGERDADLDLSDPRSEAMGDRVMREVIELNARGRWQEARERFDPAYAPVFGWIKRSDRNLEFVTILGPDELLVRRGAPWQADGVTFHLRGGTATPVDDVLGVHRSRSRDVLVLARRAGLEVRDARAGIAGLAGPPIAAIPWPAMDALRPRGLAAEVVWVPDDPPLHVESLEVSDDGMRIVVTFYRQGILLASRHPGEPTWTVLWPDARAPYASRDDAEAPRPGDMTHAAISRDGTRLAFGCQDAGHFLAEIGAGGDPSWYATAGHLSEYPHYACFSDDGRYTALNSCHFYNGGTIAFDWDGARGATLPAYEASDGAPVIDGSLRVYAATWLPRPVLDALLGKPAKSAGAFLLAGNGIMRLVNVTGALGMAQGFGSSAGGIDFCPESRRLALSCYSGFVHLYDPYEEELPGRIDGYRPRRELARWAMWEHLPNGPIRW